jgi:hypothetical protein
MEINTKGAKQKQVRQAHLCLTNSWGDAQFACVRSASTGVHSIKCECSPHIARGVRLLAYVAGECVRAAGALVNEAPDVMDEARDENQGALAHEMKGTPS